MANVEDASNADIIFRGTDGNQCEAFVVAIRDIAFTKGKDEDHSWMLRYATTRLRGKALRWHAKLDLSVQQSWHLLVQALFEEYPFVGERDGDGMATPVWTATTFSPPSSTTALPGNGRYPTGAPVLQSPVIQTVPSGESQLSGPRPAADELVSPPRVYDPSSTGYQMGRLRVVYEEDLVEPHYVWWGHEFSVAIRTKCVTSNIQEALVVAFIPSSEPHHIGCINCRQFSKPNFAVRLFPPRSLGFHPLISTSGPPSAISIYTGPSASPCPEISNIWSISADGTLNATIPDLVPKAEDKYTLIPSDYFSTSAVYVDISGTMISFVKHNGASRLPNSVSGLPAMRARIVFEPL